MTDAHGNTMTGGAVATEHYDVALDRLLRLNPDVVRLTRGLTTDHPDAPMGFALAAYLHLTSTDAPDVAGASEAASALRALGGNDRETAHSSAIDRWIAGDWQGASRDLDHLLAHHPTDLLALFVGHQVDFFLGDAINLRDRVARSIGTLAPDHDHRGFLLGMQSFGLEEIGTYDAALADGLAAVDAHPDDVWAVHAVAHVHEMRGDVDTGIRFMTERESDWGTGNFFAVHLWWHLALYLLEAGRIADVHRIYDASIHNESSDGTPLEMLDASALLWRLRLDGLDTGDRFPALADAWSKRVDDEPWYVFNDVHAVIALCGAERLDEARAVVDRLDAYVASDDPGVTNRIMTAQIGLPAARSFIAHTEGRHDEVVGQLMTIRRIANRFGGSHAQRDVLQRTLVDSAMRSGQLDLAAALLRERINLRESSVFGWDRYAQLAEMDSDPSTAAGARERAAQFRTRFAAAVPAD